MIKKGVLVRPWFFLVTLGDNCSNLDVQYSDAKNRYRECEKIVQLRHSDIAMPRKRKFPFWVKFKMKRIFPAETASFVDIQGETYFT